MLVRLAGSVADLPTLPPADFTAPFNDVLPLDSDDARVTDTCLVAWQPTVTLLRRHDDGDDEAELVCLVLRQLTDGHVEVSRKDALRYTPTNDGVLSLSLATVALGDENER